MDIWKAAEHLPTAREAAEEKRLAPQMRALKALHSLASPGEQVTPEELEKQLEKYFGLSETTASARAKETLEEVAEKFDATSWLTNNELNETAVNALKSITDDKLELTQRLCVDVMELTPSGRTAVTIPDNREIYSNSYWDPGPESGGPYYDSCLTNYGQLSYLLSYLHRNNAELYAGTFQNGGKTYAAMVIIF